MVGLVTAACALAARLRHGPALSVEPAKPDTYLRGTALTALAVTASAPVLTRPALDGMSGRGRQLTTLRRASKTTD